MNAIEAINISKIYKIYDSPVQRMKEIFLRRTLHSEFVALNNINFTVKKGETFGIIGENGAGKSTLLKILANTLKPTSGLLHINGRVAALLELGAGFNPELTGEENIYLNAYLMGLKKDEVLAKRDEIVSFSELSDFIKRPVKTYSSGMYVRLAFSIATSVDPDILIVDEALAVGDEYFQKKSIDKMMHFREMEKTILFCSHNMYYIQELCNQAIWLHGGQIKLMGKAGKVVTEYQNYERKKSTRIKKEKTNIVKKKGTPSGKHLRILQIRIMNMNLEDSERFNTFDALIISIKTHCDKKKTMGYVGFAIIRNDDVMAFGTLSRFDGLQAVRFSGEQEFRVKIRSLPLLTGLYRIKVIISDEHALHPYDVMMSKPFSVNNPNREFGITFIDHEWML